MLRSVALSILGTAALLGECDAFAPASHAPSGLTSARTRPQISTALRFPLGFPALVAPTLRKTSLFSSPSESDEPLTLSAYDQLVLSVRSLTAKEIKAELVTREVGHEDCFEKEELVQRLVEARLQVAAEALGEGEIQVDEEETVVMKKEDEPGPDPEKHKEAGFGTAAQAQDFLKTMSPAKIQKLMGDQELMAAIRNPTVMKMAQEVMQDKSAINKYADNPDVLRAMQKIKDFMNTE